MKVQTIRRRIVQLLAMSLGGFLLACEATTETIALDDAAAAMNKDMAGQVTAGIRPVENEVIAGQSMEVMFYLNNGTDEPIEVLPWGTPLETIISADLFFVSKNGERLPYAGRLVKRPAPTAEDYITIEAGEKRESVLNLSQAYDVRDSGDYQIELKSMKLQAQKGSVATVTIDTSVEVVRQ